jgi:hypothetical protein
MTAPLPLRFYNPVKDLCEKVNLDYETVIGTGLSAKMRETYVLADIAKEMKDIDGKDRKNVKHKIEFLNRKYGDGNVTPRIGEGEVEDKGRIRYDSGLIVEPVLSDDCKVDESNTIRYGLENRKPIKPRTDIIFCPGKGVIPRNQLGGP